MNTEGAMGTVRQSLCHPRPTLRGREGLPSAWGPIFHLLTCRHCFPHGSAYPPHAKPVLRTLVQKQLLALLWTPLPPSRPLCTLTCPPLQCTVSIFRNVTMTSQLSLLLSGIVRNRSPDGDKRTEKTDIYVNFVDVGGPRVGRGDRGRLWTGEKGHTFLSRPFFHRPGLCRVGKAGEEPWVACAGVPGMHAVSSKTGILKEPR